VKSNAPDYVVDESSPGTSLGRRLVAARETKGLTLQVVANKLRLSAATLQALESDRYEDLPEPIFVRGYLRSYARLLEMDGKELVAEFDRWVTKFAPVLTPTTRVRRHAKAHGVYPRAAIALTMVAMMVLFGYWWYSRPTHNLPAQSQAVSSEEQQTASSATVLPPPQVDSPTPAPVAMHTPDILSQSPASGAAETVAVIEPEPQLGEATPKAGTALPQVGESLSIANADEAVQRRDVETNVEPVIQDLPFAPLASQRGGIVRASRAPMGEDVLVIKANDKSWAEVVDVNGYQLLYYPLRPGTVLNLQGQAPFRVFLGNAPAVDLSLNQKRFDHTPFHRQNNTARFTVDDASGT